MANGLKLEGQRFGHLTVLKKLDERENRYVVWLCRCDCGNEIKVNTRHLMRGTVKGLWMYSGKQCQERTGGRRPYRPAFRETCGSKKNGK